jgi:hypothetical protein
MTAQPTFHKVRRTFVVAAVASVYSSFVLAAAEATAPVHSRFWWVDARNLDFPTRVLLDSVQAIANSNGPALLVMQHAEDKSWLKAMTEQLGEGSEKISAGEAVQHFAGNAPQVIYDPTQKWTLTLATTLAGLNHALLTDHPLDGHAVAFDCRDRWANKFEAYRWALTELLPECHRRQLAYLDEGISPLRDYAMQQRLFVLNLDPLNDKQDIELLEEILERYPPHSRIFGWASGGYARKERRQDGGAVESALVSRLSHCGMMLVAADYAANLSFYDRATSSAPRLTQMHLNRRIQFEPGKRYVLLVVSDGDNLQYDLGAMRAQWEKPRPKVPLARTISPQLVEIGPTVLQTYYQEAAERGGWDEFVAGPSGYAYVYPGSVPGKYLGEFIQSTSRACEQADIRSVVILDSSSRPAAQVENFISAYASAGFDGLWLAGMPRYVGVTGHTAFLHEKFRLNRQNPDEIARRVKEVDTVHPFVMLYVTEWDNVGDAVREFVRGLDDSCVVVSPTEMAELIRQWSSSRPASVYANAREITALPGTAQGLAPVSNGDGEFTIVDREGMRCWLATSRRPPSYFYLSVDDDFRPRPGSALEIELEYFDDGSGEIALDYDSTDVRAPVGGAYKRHPHILHRSNTLQWQQARFQLADGRFLHSQNNGADFRFYYSGDGLLIRAVRVRRAAP